MDVRSGKIHEVSAAQGLKSVPEGDIPFLREMLIPPTPSQRAKGHIGRNDPCPCASGKKFKRCCRVRAVAR
jgi:uncharacterized protein YecA (UPF0149 family)